ncbi:MarR family winged helix-turn-helix transcriptional regulator [Janibacter sp. GXQ6167]|uniref:MarR family winged helix-turn-helix transcriptional regulator n=1 Tax=Janibacter sp. GXQ6167 TaxID=3240791 RepID=UPI0035245514
MSDAPLLGDQLCFVMYAASRSLTNAYRPGLARLGLTYPQFVTLLVVAEHDGLGVAELAARLHLDASTLSPLLKRMEALGLIERTRSSTDERRVVVTLTEAGRDMTGPAAEVREEVAARLALTPEEAETLRTLSQRLIAGYEDTDPA